MPFVSLDQNGNVTGVFANPQSFATTFVADGSQSLITPTLVPYANAKQTAISGGGISVNVGTSTVECSTDVASLILLQGAASIAAANPSETFNWVPSTGTPVTLTAAQITTMFGAVSAFIQATFTTLSGVIAAINAGTITTTAQIDRPPSPIPAWPVNS